MAPAAPRAPLEAPARKGALELIIFLFGRWAAVLCLIDVGVHLAFAQPEYTILARALSAVPGIVFIASTASYFRQFEERLLPFGPLATLQYYISFGVPVFYRLGFRDLDGPVSFTESEMAAATAAVALGAVALGVGGVVGREVGRAVHPWMLRALPPAEVGTAFTRVVCIHAVACVVISLGLQLAVGKTTSALVYPLVLGFGIPTGIAMLVSSPTTNRKVESRFLALLLLGGLLQSLLGGMLGHAIQAAMIAICGAVAVRRNLRLRLVVFPLVLFLVLNPVKHEFRRATWEEDDLSTLGKLSAWSSALSSNSSNEQDEESRNAARLSELNAVAHALTVVPTFVPHNYGREWSYLLVAPVPRLIWPDKPTTQETSQRYAVEFHRQTEDGAQSTAILEPIVVDGYWSFGWSGIVIACFLVGVVFNGLGTTFRAHWAATAVGAGLLAYSNAVAPLSYSFAGVFQQLVAYSALTWVLSRLSGVRRQAREPELDRPATAPVTD